MGKGVPMHEVNCRLVQEKDGKATLVVSSRRTAVVIPRSWIALRRRKPKPGDPRSAEAAKKYPMVLRIPLDLAKRVGIA